ncbi:MAG: hydroxysqualene dehydroxylase HpnE [Puniceicoccales bacterium]|jgi:squalene-associated FAD-dependent desaturase|nr:hydroxysqualene dehydroxylase HpnE [Puniceicoccales bacterium]
MSSTDDQQQAIARKKSNLALAFSLAGLTAPRQRAMEVFYSFCRVADDIVDDPATSAGEKHAALDQLRAAVRGFFDAPGGTAPHDTLTAQLREVVHRYGINIVPLLDIIDGCAMDIGQREYANADELRTYCRGVAGAVGIVSCRIFGCVSPLSDEFAVALGYALQFTNILRDVQEDYHVLGRIYIPRDEMESFGVKPDDLVATAENPARERLFHLQYFRAKHYFNKARRLVAPEDRKALRAAFYMGAFYESILEKIKAGGFRLSRGRVRLNALEKARALRRVAKEIKDAERANSGAPVRVRPRKVVVVGGGVAGISAAVEAALNGDTVELFEGRAGAGGRAGQLRRDGSAHAAMTLGHHAIFGCYHSFLRLTDLVGARGDFVKAERLDIPYRSPGGRKSTLRTFKLPAPLHLIGALMGFAELSWRDKLAVCRLGLGLRLGTAKPIAGETASAWLTRTRQTSGAVRALWEPFCIAALNEPIETGDAVLLAESLRRALFGSARDTALVSCADATDRLIATPAARCLGATGGAIRTRTRVTSLVYDGAKAVAAVIADGTTVPADAFILAVPPQTAKTLFDAACSPEQLCARPILNIHLSTDKALMEESFTALLDSPVQWVFRKSATPPRCHYTLTISCPDRWIFLLTKEIVSNVKAELARFFPAMENAAIADVFVYKHSYATFAATPESAAARPHARTSLENVFLAGDWTRTGLPATLEGAALSGRTAARVAGGLPE